MKSIPKQQPIKLMKSPKFQSPKSKLPLTPKVTEVYPVTEPHYIFGKPKVRLNDDYGCPEHSPEDCPPPRAEPEKKSQQ